MASKKSKRTAAPAAREAGGAPASPRSAALPNCSLPTVTTRTWVSLWLGFHLLALTISYTSVVEPSNLHAQLSDIVHPYLRPAHFGADDRPVYLTHAQPLHQPHRLQVTTAAGELADLDDQAWQPIALPASGWAGTGGLAASDRFARWLSTVTLLAENEQPSLVAELLVPVARQNEQWTGIRIQRLPTELNDVRAEPETQYVARIVRRGSTISLVRLQSPRLSADARPPANNLPSGSAEETEQAEETKESNDE